jgi:hypothetical protein
MDRKTDDTLDLDLNWQPLDNDDANGLDIEEDTLHISGMLLSLFGSAKFFHKFEFELPRSVIRILRNFESI